MNILILTSPDQWFVPYAEQLQIELDGSDLLLDHTELEKPYDIVFILSYHRLIPSSVLEKNRHNIVIHASALPKGKGWSPMFWQILEGRNRIPFSMFEASSGVDDGAIYMVRYLELTGYELNTELRALQAEKVLQMCREFIDGYDAFLPPNPQKGHETFYAKRGQKESRLDSDKSIREQFNLLRIVDNEHYPAYFEIDGRRYTLKIEHDDRKDVE